MGISLIPISPEACSIEHSFRHLLAVRILPWENGYTSPLFLFLIRLFCAFILLLSLQSSLLFWELTLYQMWILDVIFI